MVLLVRHGTTPTTGKMLPGRAPGLHLAEKGRQQAAAAAERIADMAKPPTAIYASPLERTRETAAPIASALKLRVRTLARADWRPTSATGPRSPWPSSTRPRNGRPCSAGPAGSAFPGVSPSAEMSTRSMDAVLELVASHPGETIVAVSHADPIKAIVAAAAGVPLDLMQRIVISPCSISALLFPAGGPAVLCVNSTGTLSELVLS